MGSALNFAWGVVGLHCSKGAAGFPHQTLPGSRITAFATWLPSPA